MGDLLEHYMSTRLGEVSLHDIKTTPGPVITLSRTAGCSAQKVSKALALKLNEISGFTNWQVISKEVLHDSAQELKLHPNHLKNVFKVKDRSLLENIVEAFISYDFQMEKKMRHTVINVIHRFAIEGHKIIIGRGANTICADIQDSLHIRLNAPLDWRIERVCTTKGYNREQAIKFIEQTEEDRSNFRKSIKGKSVNSEDFDLTINQAKFSTNQIIDIIVCTLKHKGVIK
jgi:cytidylate kinase